MWLTKWNYDPLDQPGEVNNLPSMTIPDQSMSVMELMQRQAQGLPLGGGRKPIWDGEEFMPDLARLDLTERMELMKKAQQEFYELRNKQEEKRRRKPVNPIDELKAQMEQLRASIVDKRTLGPVDEKGGKNESGT